MKNAKRLLVLVPAVLTMVLAACGPVESSTETSKQPDPTSNPSTTTTQKPSGTGFITEPVTIHFWHTFGGGKENFINNYIETFKEIEPNVTVVAKKEGDYDGLRDAVVSGIPVDNYPDMFLGYPDSFCEVMNYNKMVNLEPYIKDVDNVGYGWKDMNDIIPNYIEEGKDYPIKGVYSVPWAKSTECLYYNKSLLIGLDLSAEDNTINKGEPINELYMNSLTWEELFNKFLPAIKAHNDKLGADDKIYLTDQPSHGMFGYDSDDNLFITLAEQYGYAYTAIDEFGKGQVLFDNEGMRGLLKWFHEQKAKDFLITKGSTTDGKTYTNTLVGKKNCLMTVGSTGGLDYQVKDNPFEMAIAKIPHAEGRDPRVINQGPSLGILKHTTEGKVDKNRILATWLFYRHMANKENALDWAINSSYMPIRYSTYESADYDDLTKTEGKTGLSLLKARCAEYVGTVSDDLYTSPVFKGSSTCRKQVGGLTAEILKQTTLTDEVLNEKFATAVNNCLTAMA